MAGLLTWTLEGLAGVSLPGWIGAVIVLGLALAISYFLRKPLVAILTAIPVIGGAAASVVVTVTETIVGWAMGWLGSIGWYFAQAVMSVASLVVGGTSALVGTAEYLMGNTKRTSSTLYSSGGLVARTGQAESNIGYLSGTAIPRAQATAISQANTHSGLLVGSEATTRASRDAAVAAAAAEQLSAEAAARARAVDAARNAAAAAVATEALARQAGDSLLERQAAAAAAASAAALAALRDHVTDLENVRVHGLEETVTDLEDRVIPEARAEAKAATDALAVDMTAAQVALECLAPLCGTGVADLLGRLAQGAELILVMELLGGAAQHPAQSAQDASPVIDQLLGTARGFVSPFVGGL